MIYQYVAIEGNIGAGKTTLTSLLAKEFGGRIILEQFRENPFLAKFYQEPERYAFQLEMSFLLERFRQLNEVLSEPEIFSKFTVSDYIFKKSLLFAKINLSKEEFSLYKNFFDVIYKKLPKPDIIFYLHADTQQLLNNIKKRARPYEQSINKHYLNKIEKTYFQYFKQVENQKIVIVNVNQLDWIGNVFVFKNLVSLFNKEYKVGMNIVDLNDEHTLF